MPLHWARVTAGGGTAPETPLQSHRARVLDFDHGWWNYPGVIHGFASGQEPMKSFLIRFFTWWNGQTFGTQFWTWLHGEHVGDDEFGNRYFRTKGGKIDKGLGFERRWVIYNGTAEASTVPPS